MLSDILGGSEAKAPNAKAKFNDNVLVYSRDPSEKPKLKEFEVISLIGQGSISKVYLVYRQANNKVYAMKCISKANIMK